MWCSILGYDCTAGILCQNCPAWKASVQPLPEQHYKYKCPCGGEFVEASSKWIIPPLEGDNTGITGVVGYCCPFCGKRMEGF